MGCMTRRRMGSLLGVASLLVAGAGSGLARSLASDTTPIACDSCAEWNAAQAPFRIQGNAYYVGPRGLSVVLVVTSGGLALFDGALPQSVPGIVSNIRKVGRKIEEVKWIFVSHPHFDHAGGVAALARLSGARVAASPAGAKVLRAGMVGTDDPQAGFGESMRFSPVAKVIELADGATVKLGEVTFTAHHSPGHMPGGTSWSWSGCGDAGCAAMVYADSLNAVSAPGFRFGDQPDRVRQFRSTIAAVGALPCDVLMCPHPTFCGMFERRERPDRGACVRYAAEAAGRLDRRLADERREQADAGAYPPRR
jgi:metallo-beta-lactamase class B